MRYGLTPVDYVLWVAAILASSYLLGVLFRKENCTSFPYFAIYTAGEVVNSLILWYTHFRCGVADYVIAYYSGQFLLAVLSLFVMAELIRSILAPYNCLPASACRDLTLWTCTAVMLSLCAVWPFMGDYYASVRALDQFCRYISIAAMAVVLWKVWDLNLPVTERCQLILAGLAFSGAVQSIASCFALSGRAARYSRPVGSVAYLVTVFVWTIAFSRGEQAIVFNDEAVDVLKKKINASVRLIQEASCVNS